MVQTVTYELQLKVRDLWLWACSFDDDDGNPTGSLWSPRGLAGCSGGGTQEEVRGEAAQGKAMVGPGKKTIVKDSCWYLSFFNLYSLIWKRWKLSSIQFSVLFIIMLCLIDLYVDSPQRSIRHNILLKIEMISSGLETIDLWMFLFNFPGLDHPPVPPSDLPTTSSSGKLMFSLDWLCCLQTSKEEAFLTADYYH